MFAVWAYSATRAEPRNVEPFVCALDQGWCDGAECDTPLPQEVRDHAALQANMSCNKSFTQVSIAKYNIARVCLHIVITMCRSLTVKSILLHEKYILFILLTFKRV